MFSRFQDAFRLVIRINLNQTHRWNSWRFREEAKAKYERRRKKTQEKRHKLWMAVDSQIQDLQTVKSTLQTFVSREWMLGETKKRYQAFEARRRKMLLNVNSQIQDLSLI